MTREIPPALAPLLELSLDLRWTWSHATDHVWERLDPEVWARTANPWLILQSVPRQRLAELAADEAFTDEVARLAAARRAYLDAPPWSMRQMPEACSAGTVAYFSMEYGLGEALPIYSGGLGVLAGDHLKTASDLGLPIVGVGLLYQQGYFRQSLDAEGNQLELHPQNVPTDLPLTPVLAADGTRLAITVPLPGRVVRLRVWLAQVGRVPLYLLDSNDPLNSPGDRGITAQLYVTAEEPRLLQQIMLGIGGWRMLQALRIPVRVCHLNEGHAALVALERAGHFAREQSVGFAEALWATRAGNVFTTHTAMSASLQTYSPQLIRQYGATYAELLGVPLETLLALGRGDAGDAAERFNMTFLALRTSGAVNGVSTLHGAVSRRMFQGLYPRWPVAEVPVSSITNGVHMPTWDSAAADALWTTACGADRWREPCADMGQRIAAAPDEAIWAMRGQERGELIAYARRRLGLQLGQRGAAPGEQRRAAVALDPNTLTLGFARRFTAYKRPHLLLQDPERLARLLCSDTRPVQIIVAGKAHPADSRGKGLLREWARFVARPDMRQRAVLIEDYDMALAGMLVQGIDVWLNTPLRPWEASGTSGMKVLVNGGLNLSSLDGWWAEAHEPDVGWALGDAAAASDPERPPSAAEVDELFRILEEQVVPEFYDRDAGGIPRRWTARVRTSMSRLTPRFSSTRMVLQYATEAYVPAALEQARRAAEGSAVARELAAWEARLRRYWHEIHLGPLRATPAAADRLRFEVPVYMGELSPGDVEVQLYAEAGDAGPAVCAAMQPGEGLAGATNGFLFAVEVAGGRPAGHFTPRVVPRSAHARVPLELPLIRWGGPA